MENACSRCGRAGVVYVRRYSGERLCRACFLETFERRVYRTITRYDMLREDDTIAVALSGGKDSIALLKVLAKIERRFPRARLVAVTVDEGISGYREEALEYARRVCEELGVEQVLVSFSELYGLTMDEAVRDGYLDELGLGPCTVCGVMRRRAIELGAMKAGATVIATAHTLDDIVQTYLMNLLRGDLNHQPLGLRRESEGVLPRVSPFRLTPQREVILYAVYTGIPMQEVECPYGHLSQRALIRSFLTEFEERFPGSLYAALMAIEGRLISGLQEDRKVGEGGGRCGVCGSPTFREVCRSCELISQIAGIRASRLRRSAAIVGDLMAGARSA
ncbi:MAG: TIGR00269 family protein [Nitrososphaerota archaeon]|nr:TIGR00269 family protein [Candidatus Calditenuis fumarioli]